MSQPPLYDMADRIPSSTNDLLEGKEEGSPPYNPCWYLLGVVVIILLIFPVICIPILFNQQEIYKSRFRAEVNTYVEGDTNVVTTVQGGSTNVVSVFGLAATPTTDFSYQAASISATGHLQQGAGTTIYKNIGAIPATGCPKYLSGTAVFNDEYIVSYKNKITGQASVHVMTVNENRETTVLSTAFQNVDMYDIVTLNKGTGLFVSISQDDTWPVSSNSEVIIAGKVGPAPDYVITFGASTHYGLPSTSSIDPAITALSNTTFAIAYFSPVAQGQSALRCWTRFGVVDPVTFAVTLSARFNFADDGAYSATYALAGLTSDTYMVAYYGDVSSAGPLTAIVITANVISSTNITLSRVVGPKSYTGTSLTGVLRATTLDNGDVVVAYSDNLSNNGVTCVQVTINMLTKSLLFGGVLAITTGETAKYVFPTGTMNIQLVTIGNGFQFMVMFSDLELDGALVAAVGESVGGALIRTSPNYLLNNGIKAKNTFHTYLSLAVSRSTLFDSRVAIVSGLTDVYCRLAPTTDFSLLEILPKPLGVVTQLSSSGSPLATVAMSGVATGFTGLTAGMTYYATTSGKLVTDGMYYGRDEATQSNSAVDGFFYIYDVDDNLLVSAESQVGIAISSTSMLLDLV